MNKQYIAARLSEVLGARVSVGLHRWIEDVRDPETGKIVEQIVHDEGEKYTRDDGVPVGQSDIDAAVLWLAANPPPPEPAFVEGAAFMARFTDDEYAAARALEATNPQVARWLDTLRVRGEIDVNGRTAQAAKASLVALGVLTQARADETFVP